MMDILCFHDFELDPNACELRRSGRRIALQPRPFDALAYLAARPRHVVSRDELLREVWGVSASSASTVPTCIAEVRRALGDDAQCPRYIETVRGRGYRFVAATHPADHGKPPVLPGRPSPQLEASPPRSPFVGREAEIAVLGETLDATLAGRLSLVSISGEAGIGKTRLLDEFSAISARRGVVPVVVRCPEDGQAPALWPWYRVVRQLVDREARNEPIFALGEAILRRLGPSAHDPASSDEPPTTGPDPERFRLLDDVARFLGAIAERAPLVLLFDDAQRADPDSLSLLGFLADELADRRVLAVLTERLSGEADDRGAPLAHLGRHPRARLLHLFGLPQSAVAAWLERSGMDEARVGRIAEALHSHTAGNAFFISQLLPLLESQETAEREDHRAAPVAFPRAVRQAIVAQIDDFPEETRHLLVVAAVEGRTFSLRVLARLLDVHADLALRSLQPAFAAGLLDPAGEPGERWRFHHSLLRDAIYQGIPLDERAELHRRVGGALEVIHEKELDSKSAEIAHHFVQAAHVGAAESAVRYSLMAGEWATRCLAYEAAPRHFAQALDMLDLSDATDGERRARILLALGRAQLRAHPAARSTVPQTGSREIARETLRQAATLARNHGAPSLIAEAALSLAPGPLSIEVGANDALLVSLLEESLATIPQGDTPLRATLLARLAVALRWSNATTRRDEIGAEALRIARKVQDDDPIALAHALLAHHGTIAGAGHLAERTALVEEMGWAARTSNSSEWRFMHRLLRSIALMHAGDMAVLDEETDAFEFEFRELRLPQYLWYENALRATRALQQGDFDESIRQSDRAMALAQRLGDENAVSGHAARIAIIHWERGEHDLARGFAEAALQRLPSLAPWRLAAALFCCEAGRPEACARHYEQVAGQGFDSLPRTELWEGGLFVAAHVCARLGDQPRAAQLYELLAPGTGRHAVLGFAALMFASTDLVLGMLAATLGRGEQAARHFEAAIAQDRRAGSWPWVAHAQLEYARLLTRSPETRQHARRRCDEASTLAERHGMATVGRRAMELRAQLDPIPS